MSACPLKTLAEMILFVFHGKTSAQFTMKVCSLSYACVRSLEATWCCHIRNKITDAQINALFAQFTTLLSCAVVPLLADFAPAAHTLCLVLLIIVNLILMCTILIYYVYHMTPADPLVRGRAPIGANLGGIV